jgi:hypothetical protein
MRNINDLPVTNYDSNLIRDEYFKNAKAGARQIGNQIGNDINVSRQ